MKIKEKWVSWEEMLPGFTHAIDFQKVGGMTPGSIPFADATGFLTQDNANLSWNATLNVLEILTPTENIYIGKGVIGAGVSTGQKNVYVGYEVGHDAEDAWQNVIIGWQAGYKHTSGGQNTLIGYYTGRNITTSQLNTCVGASAGSALTTGLGQNTLLGLNAGGSMTTGHHNISIGKDSGTTITTGKGNICLGHNAESWDADANYRIAIGYGAQSKENNLCAIGGDVVSYHLAIFHKREFRFYEGGAGTNYVGFEAPELELSKIWVLPAADGGAGEAIITDGDGNLSFAFVDHDLLTNTHDNPYKLDDLAAPDDNTDLDFSTLLHGLVPKGTNVGNFLKDDGTWAAGGGGESNTASNQGSGVSIYFQKVGVDLQFNAIKSESNRLAVALDGVTHDVELTLVEGNIDHDALANTHANPYKLDDLAVPDDNTDLDFSTLLHGLVPKGTNVGHFLKDDGTWAAGGGGGAVIFPDLTDTPANYVGAADKIVKVNATPDALEFGADIEDLENVDTLVDQAGKYAKVKVGDAGIEWDTPAGGNGAIDYLDLFEDESIHWSWRTHNTDVNRTIVEAANKLTIAIAGGTNGNWWSTLNNAPKVITGIGRPPCEIITKLITVTTNNETRCGIFVSSNPIAFGVDYAMLLTRSTVGGVEGLQVQRSGTGYTTYQGAPYTTLPIWLKIRITADIRYGNHLRFYYSVNGTDWTELADPAGGYSDLLTSDGFAVGLYAENWSAFNAISAEFDFFKVVPSLGADG